MTESWRPTKADMVAGGRKKPGMIGRHFPIIRRVENERRHRRFGQLSRADELVERTSGYPAHLVG